MTSSPTHAPGIPADYYEKIFTVEDRHWWYSGMRGISSALLGPRLERPAGRVLDAGCGTGGYLSWLLEQGTFDAAAGADIASAAIALARDRLPEADLRVAPLRALPFDDASFDLVVTNDVLQHVPEEEVGESLGEIHRVLAPGGTLLLRTNGSRRLRRERHDWRAYDRSTLSAELEAAGLECERVTYANSLLSLYGALRGRTLRAPSADRDGIPRSDPPVFVSAVGSRILAAEARYLSSPGRTLPYGHTLFAVATAFRR